jgi:hypothetical protein
LSQTDQPGHPGAYGKGPLSPTTDITPTVPNAFKQINPNCPGGHCEVWIHDRATNFYHIGPIADYNPADIDCVCALVAGVSNPLNLSCRALLQQVVDSTAGNDLGREVPWLQQNSASQFDDIRSGFLVYIMLDAPSIQTFS